jgi:HTH-like domain
MRSLRYSINITLDGCCDHRAILPDEELHRHHAQNLERADALLLGRVTYEMMEAAWRPVAHLQPGHVDDRPNEERAATRRSGDGGRDEGTQIPRGDDQPGRRQGGRCRDASLIGSSPTAVAHMTLAEMIARVHAEVQGRYGRPRMTAELNARGHKCSENTVARVMREHGIRAKAPRQRIRTTDSNRRLPVADNLLARDFDPTEPNRAWSADITCIPTGEEWMYLAVVEDLFSRMTVGRSMAVTGECSEYRGDCLSFRYIRCPRTPSPLRTTSPSLMTTTKCSSSVGRAMRGSR